MKKIRTHYDNLKVSKDAPPEVIKAAYKSLIQKYHPDRNLGDKRTEHITKIINEAYRVLSDPKLRAEHDKWISSHEEYKYKKAKFSKDDFSEDDNVNNKYQTQPSNESSKETQNQEKESINKKSDKNRVNEKIAKFSTIKEIFHTLVAYIIYVVAACIVLGLILNFFSSSNNYNDNEQYNSSKVLLEEDKENVSASAEENSVLKEGMEAKLRYEQSKAEYENSINTINLVWNSLHESTRDELKAEQKSFDKRRELNCRQKSEVIGGTFDEREAFRYLCESTWLSQRTEELRQYIGKISYKPLPLPKTGSFSKAINGEAPLKIKTAYRSNYFLKIVDANHGKEVSSYFIRGGDTLDVDVPLGSYKIKYASGSIWYGKKYLFGEETQYTQVDGVLDFSFDGESYLGHSIELIQQINGNLKTTDIDKAEF